ncbi:MAG: hypothetical protein RR978_07930 [Oscillospiraceae bacterium]
MKKFMSTVLVLAIAAAMSVSAFAVKATGYTKDEMKKLIADNASKYTISSAEVAEAEASIDAMTDAAVAKVDVVQVKTATAPTLNKKVAGTLTVADLKAAETAVNAVLAPAGVTVSVASLSVSGNKITGSAVVAIAAASSVTGSPVAKILNAETPNPDPAPSVIKKTGADLDMTGVTILALSVIAVLGAGVVVTRKLGLAE